MFWMIKERCRRASTIQQVRIQTLKRCSKWKSCKQRTRGRIWVWEGTTLKAITKLVLFNNNTLTLKGRWKRMIRIMSHKTKFLRLEEVILLTIHTKKLILQATLICSNPFLAHYRNKIAKTKQPMKFWILNLKTHQGWIILYWNLKELYFMNSNRLNINTNQMNKRMVNPTSYCQIIKTVSLINHKNKLTNLIILSIKELFISRICLHINTLNLSITINHFKATEILLRNNNQKLAMMMTMNHN